MDWFGLVSVDERSVHSVYRLTFNPGAMGRNFPEMGV